MFLPPMRIAAFAILASVLLPSTTLVASAQNTGAPGRAQGEKVPNSANRGHSLGQVAVSPDGKRLAWIEGGRRGGEIRVAAIDNLAKSEHVTAAATVDQHCAEGQLAWEPDSKALAFFSDCAAPAVQNDLYIWSGEGNTRRLTELHGYLTAPAFSPDGKAIAFLYVDGATRPAGALAAMKSPSGVIGEDGVEIQRIAVARLDAAAPNALQVSPGNLHVYEFDWSPDSKSFAYIAADPPGENNWWVAKLYTQPMAGAPKAILDPQAVSGDLHGLQIAVPRWSPDGKKIAFIGGLMSDQGVIGGDVWVMPSAGGQPYNLTQLRPSSPAWISWDGDDQIDVGELAGGNSQFVRLSVGAHCMVGTDARANTACPPSEIRMFSFPGDVGDGRTELSLSTMADHSLFVFNASSFEHPAEVYLARPGEQTARGSGGEFAGLTKLTHIDNGIQPTWGKTVSLDWKSDAFNVQGWLMLPTDYDPARKYPMIVEVHGGPAAAVKSKWGGGAGGFSSTALSARGYFVFMPNPRGSYGQGEAFTQANRKDFGYGDLRDILAGVDAVQAKYSVDPNRVGIAGWSYGGFMTMFAVTQTNRFKAAVSGAGISNWQSYYGENSIDQWMIPYFGASVYDDPAVYARSSAINYIKQAHTPTLSVVGDRDGECPAPQSFEFWHALRAQHIPAQLVVYPNEGHGFVDPAHTRDVLERAIGWFDRYMPALP